MQWIVTVQQQEENVYFCDKAPNYHSVMDAEGSYTGKVDVSFIPGNGKQRGNLHVVPRERVISVVRRTD